MQCDCQSNINYQWFYVADIYIYIADMIYRIASHKALAMLLCGSQKSTSGLCWPAFTSN